MSFAAYEESRSRGEPTELYSFRYDASGPSVVNYVDTADPLIFKSPVDPFGESLMLSLVQSNEDGSDYIVDPEMAVPEDGIDVIFQLTVTYLHAAGGMTMEIAGFNDADAKPLLQADGVTEIAPETYGISSVIHFFYDSALEVFRVLETEDVEYLPLPISRSGISATGSIDKISLEVRVPHDSEIASMFNGFPPSFVIMLTIRQGHLTNPDEDFPVSWVGRVLSCSFESATAVLRCEPASTSMRRVGLRRHYQYGCPHALYGPQCRADREAATVSVEIGEISGSILTLPENWGDHETAKYLGGLVVRVDETGRTHIRTVIRAVTEEQIVMSGPISGLEAGDSIDVVLGCNHQMGDCLALHDNIHNYGGQPFIPNRSPIGIVNQYY